MQIDLSTEQYTMIEAYLEGRISDTQLEQIPFTDLSQVTRQREQILNTMYALIAEEKSEEITHFFHALFAVGGATGYRLFPWSYGVEGTIKRADLFGVDPAKLCVIVAESVAERQDIKDFKPYKFIQYAKKDYHHIRKALEYHKNQSQKARLILLCTYFLMKYPQEQIDLELEDEALLKDYEEIILHNTEQLFCMAVREEKAAQIVDAIKTNTLSALKLSGKIHLDAYLSYLVVGCAFANAVCSTILENVVRLCLLANPTETLHILWEMDMRGKMRNCAKDFDIIYNIPPEKLIAWAASEARMEVLKEQFIRNKDCYLEVLKRVSYKGSKAMFAILEKSDASLYETLIKQENKPEMEKVITMVVHDKSAAGRHAKAYLRGDEPIDALCAISDKIGRGHCSYQEYERIAAFYKMYKDEEFYRRCTAYMMLRCDTYFFSTQLLSGKKEDIKKIFDSCKQEHMTIACQFESAALFKEYLKDYNEEIQKGFVEAIKEIFGEYLKNDKEETICAFANASVQGRLLALNIYQIDIEAYKEQIWSYTKDTSKVIREKVIEIACGQEGWSKDVIELLHSAKASEREMAVCIIGSWSDLHYKELLKEALEKEKSKKVYEQIMEVLGIEDTVGDEEKSMTAQVLVQQLLKGNAKKSVAWAYETPFSTVHFTDGTPAQEEYLQALLLCYASMSQCGINKKAALLAKELDRIELAVYVNELFDKWIAAEAEAKRKWVLYAASIHGDLNTVKKLQRYIQEWAKHMRRQIAAEAVQALALNPQPQALLIVNSIARKFKFKQVKAAASNALELAAQQLGVSRAQLEDKIVPTLDFTKDGERVFDYGKRKFTVVLTSSFELEILGEDGKKRKSMPAPGKQDDAQKAKAAYEAYKEMKQQVKTVVASQRERLEEALAAARRWSDVQWKELFVQNPIMHQFAIGLIWGIYENEQLTQSFRYMEDGSFNTIEEEEYCIEQDAQIGLVHPVELSQEERLAWTEQLKDYEIVQPFDQIERKIYVVTEEEKQSKRLERFGGIELPAVILTDKLQRFGWEYGSILDGGGFDTYFREDMDVGLGVDLYFSGSYMGWDDTNVTMYYVRFYKLGTVEKDDHFCYNKQDKNSLFLKDVPARYFSEVVLQLDTIALMKQGYNNNWKQRL